MPKSTKPVWICTICGYHHHHSEAPAECPFCKSEGSLFKFYSTDDNPDMNIPCRYLIVGSGIAGISAAESIRKTDPTGSIVIMSSEHELPYFRMNLTRYLAGEVENSKLALHPETWYEQNRIFLHQDSTVAEIKPEKKTIVLTNGKQVPYDRLILAVGASPFVPPFSGSHLKNVITIRTIPDTEILLSACHECINVVCIGGGLLGLETAGAINHQGARVTVIEALPWLLPRQLDKTASVILQEKINSMGIKIIVGAKTQALLGEDAVYAVQLDDGQLVPADMVVISAGVHANTTLAKQAGLQVNRGIIVNDQMLTSYQDIYAVGDATEHNGILYGLWVPAKNQGTIGGLSAAGKIAEFHDLPPSARLKVLGIDLFSIGKFTPSEPEEIIISEAKNGNYASFVFSQGVIVGSILLGDASLASYVKTAVEGQKDFSPDLRENLTVSEFTEILKRK